MVSHFSCPNRFGKQQISHQSPRPLPFLIPSFDVEDADEPVKVLLQILRPHTVESIEVALHPRAKRVDQQSSSLTVDCRPRPCPRLSISFLC